ncbi:MAG TPA: hypothetical protein PKJ13_08680 [bacterium]|nr:hypothetical protein [bacterium]HPG82891.1 hypothetical protein [bacterium]HPM60475.1 hypothetical protein [bacterium]
MTIKAMLESYEAEIIILFAIVIGAIIAVKVVSAFIAGARLRAAAASAAARGEILPAGEASPDSRTTALINGYQVSGEGLSLSDVDEKTAAMILAIVAHDAGIPIAELQFKSIRATS